MSNVEHYATGLRNGKRGAITLYDRLDRGRVTAGSQLFPIEGGMLETAENLRRKYSISREAQDEYSLRSHRRAVAAWDAGKFDAETVPVTITTRQGDVVVSRDEHPRADTSLEKLAALRAVMGRQDPEATVTAGNASGENDAAAVCIVTTAEKASELGLTPMGRFLGWASAGVHPAYMGLGPVPATQKLLSRLELTLNQMDVIELNEAFAAQVLAVTSEWGFEERDFDRLNPNGSGISIGHPIGATGGRIMATMLNEMQRTGARYGLETMCIGGGQGIAAVVERI
jgi:acetyl-CoA C-acetyltransferase